MKAAEAIDPCFYLSFMLMGVLFAGFQFESLGPLPSAGIALLAGLYLRFHKELIAKGGRVMRVVRPVANLVACVALGVSSVYVMVMLVHHVPKPLTFLLQWMVAPLGLGQVFQPTGGTEALDSAIAVCMFAALLATDRKHRDAYVAPTAMSIIGAVSSSLFVFPTDEAGLVAMLVTAIATCAWHLHQFRQSKCREIGELCYPMATLMFSGVALPPLMSIGIMIGTHWMMVLAPSKEIEDQGRHRNAATA